MASTKINGNGRMMSEKKKRHSWGDLEKVSVTELQVCTVCSLCRFKLMGVWAYSTEKISEENLFVEIIENKGCK